MVNAERVADSGRLRVRKPNLPDALTGTLLCWIHIALP
jgi:hypothetical protein